ncbi:MAG: hypothetical protein WBC93_19610 [Sulfitobacter sp.]
MSSKLQRKGRPRKRKGVSLPPPLGGDHGTGTPAANAGTVVKPIDGKNPNNLGRRVRESQLEIYYKKGLLTKDHLNAGMLLLCAFEATQGGSPAIKKVNVDHSPKPDHAIEIMLKRIGGYSAIMKHVPKTSRSIISRVAVHDLPIESHQKGDLQCLNEMAKLLVGLDKMVESMNAN